MSDLEQHYVLFNESLIILALDRPDLAGTTIARHIPEYAHASFVPKFTALDNLSVSSRVRYHSVSIAGDLIRAQTNEEPLHTVMILRRRSKAARAVAALLHKPIPEARGNIEVWSS